MKTQLIIHPEELNKKWIDRLVDNNVDVLGIHPHGGGESHDSLIELIKTVETKEFRALIDYAISKGLEIEYEIHGANYLLPREMFDKNPEYFRTNTKGIRTPDYNFCISSKDAMEIICEKTIELTKKLYGSSDNYYIWLDDGKNTFCHCEKCSSLSDSDQQMIILNSMLDALKTYNSNAKLAYLAYYTTLTPPKAIKPHKDIFVEYAPIERDLSKEVSEMPLEEIQNIKNLISFFGKNNAKCLEYWLDNSLFTRRAGHLTELTPDNEMIKKDFEFYNSLGFEYISSFACLMGEEYEKLYGEPDISSFRK